MQPNSSSHSQSKTLLRREARARRDALSADQKQEYSARIVARAGQFLAKNVAQRIAIYQSNGREVDLQALGIQLLDRGYLVAAPLKVDGASSAPFGRLQSTLGAENEREILRLNPSEDALEPHEIDVFLVPALAFDEFGYRLGQGGGWYDKVLCRAPQSLVVGIAFEAQIVRAVPHQAHDQAVDFIITEERIIRCQSTLPNPLPTSPACGGGWEGVR